MTSKQLRCLVNKHCSNGSRMDVYKGTRAKMIGWFMHAEGFSAHTFLGKNLREAHDTLAMLIRERNERQRILSDGWIST